jgi:hypothetical protein
MLDEPDTIVDYQTKYALYEDVISYAFHFHLHNEINTFRKYLAHIAYNFGV